MRIIGITFLILEARGILPAIFARSAGYGDIFIGATASFVAWKLANPANRVSFIAWQVLGITDLVTAVSIGTTAPLLNPHGISIAPMTILPLSLIPTFLVPIFLILPHNLHSAGPGLDTRFKRTAPIRHARKKLRHPLISIQP